MWHLAMAIILLWVAVPGIQASESRLAVVVSQRIRPYIQVLDGIFSELSDKALEPDIFFLSSGDAAMQQKVTEHLAAGKHDLVIAIGPEAAVLIWEEGGAVKKVFTAVLDPETLLHLSDSACGISLRIPVDRQLETISETLPTFKKVGLLFDPLHNKSFFDKVCMASGSLGIEIIPLQVSSRDRINKVLTSNNGRIDAIWMIPDPTVISEKLIQYVIRQGIYRKIGVIGYNSFFIRSGALFAFEFDYETLGRQTGEKVLTYLTTGECRRTAPEFKILVNRKVAHKIGVEVTE